jgi:hypothetical protein
MSQFAIQRLMANLRVKLPGALDGPVKLEVFNAVSEFCVKSCVWQDRQPFSTRVGKSEYEMSAPQHDAYYTQLLGLYKDDGDGDDNTNGPAVKAVMKDPTTLRLLTTPTTVERLVAYFAMAPQPTDELGDHAGIPDSFWSKYHDAFYEGALSRMLAQPAKPYSNERLGIYHGRRFIAMTSVAKNEHFNGNVRGGQNWQFPKNFK